MRSALHVLCLSLLSYAAAAATPSDNRQISKLDRAVQSAAMDFFKDSCHVGLSLGVVEDGKVAYYNYGTTSKTRRQLPTRQSLYEIASITKTFTGALASKAILDGKMTLDGDFRRYLQEPYPNLELNGKPISLRTLATHTAGLPKDIPDSDALFVNPDPDKLPYQLIANEKDYDQARYLKELHDAALASEPGTTARYSNIGIKLIGFGLENLYGQSLVALLQRYITRPLGMTHTALTVSAKSKPLLVQGYSPSGKPMPYNSPNAGAAGGLYSNVQDLMKYAAWQLAETDPIVKQSHALIGGSLKDSGTGLIWHETLSGGGRKLWHSGGAYGMSSQMVLFPELGRGYVALANDGCFDSQEKLDEMITAIHAAEK